MDEFVGQQAGEIDAAGIFDQAALGGAIVARFMMLEAEMRHVVTECEEKMIIAIVAGTEEGARLRNQLVKMHLRLRSHCQGSRAVRGDVDLMRRILAGSDLDGTEIPAGKHGRIDQRFE